MGGSGLKRKSKKSDISSQKKKKKKGLRKDSKKRRRTERSVSSHSNGDLSDSEYTSSSSASLSSYKRKRTKSKKHRQAKLSISSDSDIGHSSDSDALSSDEKTHKSRRRKSRITLKKKKKINRKRYSSSDEGTYAKKARKRKRPSKDMPLKSRKKSSKKKSLKKLSSDSESYSTNPRGESSEGEKHPRKATRGREVERWASDISYKGRKRRKVRSPSCSSFSRNCTEKDSVRVSRGKEPLAQMGNYNPPRLRSVICIPNRTFDELEKDSNKEVIEHDCYDYPSPKSFESDEEQNKGEPGDYSRGESIEKFHVENYEEQIDKEIDSSACVEASSGDLELTLRQRALENLMKFRGVRKDESHGKPNNEIDAINEPKNPEISVPLDIEQTSGPTSNEDFSRPLEVEKRSPSNQQERLKEEKINSDSDFSNANKDLSLEERRNEPDKGSEFEEKTMSVMRGGEMVQVSYKVHIPKKTSHLARRQLRR